MIAFEKFLIEKGYLKYSIDKVRANGKLQMKFIPAKGHVISTLGNLYYHYFHNTDAIIGKIDSGCLITSDKSLTGQITFSDRKGEIVVGLNEYQKPPTLISPRPRTECKSLTDFADSRPCDQKFEHGHIFTFNDDFDDTINVLLGNIPNEIIYEAICDKSILFKVDSTQTKPKIEIERQDSCPWHEHIRRGHVINAKQ